MHTGRSEYWHNNNKNNNNSNNNNNYTRIEGTAYRGKFNSLSTRIEGTAYPANSCKQAQNIKFIIIYIPALELSRLVGLAPALWLARVAHSETIRLPHPKNV
jgi:hypothetical protein